MKTFWAPSLNLKGLAEGMSPNCESQARASRIDFDVLASVDEEEDEEILAAIDEGIRDTAGRTVPI